MTKESKEKINEIKEKLDYLGLDIEQARLQFEDNEPIKYSIPKIYDEKQYRQYRYIAIKDIQILLTPTNRLDDIQEKYKKASPLVDYLDNENPENVGKHAKFLEMLDKMKIDEIEEIAKEQVNLNKKIPFKVKFNRNYLWQIYYSEATDQYFMLVPTEDTDYSTFFYLLKKQLEKRKTGKIFVPITSIEYSKEYLKRSEFEDIENYLWLFTKDWPLVYEVYDKSQKLSIQIVGETEVYEKVKSSYKIKLDSKTEAIHFYTLLKAMFIIQTELPHYFNFKTKIKRNGELEFYNDDKKISFENIQQWLTDEYILGLDKMDVMEEITEENEEKFKKLQEIAASQEIEYLAKEKQISTFLECKKTFFGKFKYYFKYGKKNKKKNSEEVAENKQDESIKNDEEKEIKKKKKEKIKANYTIEEVMDLYKRYEEKETELKNLVMDINALKLKNKNMAKKIENATNFIKEIDNHKKSIFEFWKYSNKDEVEALAEGEEEKTNIIKKTAKVFDYNIDFEDYGETMDKIQRQALSREELNGVYIATTDLLPILNKVKNNDVVPKDIESSLKALKNEKKERKDINEDEFNIFGGMAQDTTKVFKIGNDKNHRESPKDKFSILEVNKNTRQIGYKMTLENIVDNIKSALSKVVSIDDLPVYKISSEDNLNVDDFNIFNINPEEEVHNNIKQDGSKFNLFKVNVKRGTNVVSLSNIIFFDNKNKTLPTGQDVSKQILVDLSNVELKLANKTSFKVVEMENEKDDFAKANVKTINVFEYDIEEKKKDE